MRIIAVFKDNTEHARTVIDFLRDFKYQTGRDIEVIDPETSDGQQFCETYDIVQYPTLIAISDDSTMQNTWNGLPLPTISEVSFYNQ